MRERLHLTHGITKGEQHHHWTSIRYRAVRQPSNIGLGSYPILYVWKYGITYLPLAGGAQLKQKRLFFCRVRDNDGITYHTYCRYGYV